MDRYERRKTTIHELLENVKQTDAPFIKICAPMVRYSKLPFREVVRNYKVDLAYTPMILADVFASSPMAREADFSTNRNEGPLVVQFAANTGKDLADATEFVAPYVDAVDINCGCPQKWAINEKIGAHLMTQPELVRDMIHQVRNRTNVPCSIKIRVHKDLRKTYEFVQRAEKVGVEWIAVHGRTTKQSSSEPVNLDAIKFVRENTSVPIIANGDVFSLDDARKIVEYTHVDGLMAARGLLKNPSLFSNEKYTPWDCVENYVQQALDYGTTTFIFHHHLMFMLEDVMSKAGNY
ncbi:tRNA dihydrouridine synthase, variant 3 [Entomophthora muscae]|uniref:tRNA dihydrouridine synthase, variant 3 n=1 Tax=Entomophthora muscae TaxID=34485 RepID=A0ACC2STT7_9FUNG|nr:tRNA dihydrouridine synthase, variant 3 [Entomophthora muscae]